MAAATKEEVRTVVRTVGKAAARKAEEAAAAAKKRASAAAAKLKVWSETDKGKRLVAGLGSAAAGAVVYEVADKVADEYPDQRLFIGLGLVAIGTGVAMMAKDPRILAGAGAVAGVGGVYVAGELKDKFNEWADDDDTAAAGKRTGCPGDVVRIEGVRRGPPTPQGAAQAARLQGVHAGPPTPQGAALTARSFR